MIKAVIFDMFETLITHYRCPLYFSDEMAADIGITVEEFRALWRPTEPMRSTGRLRFEACIERILREYGLYSPELLDLVIEKRVRTKDECFRTIHEEILPMLDALKRNGLKIALISNCFSEEAEAIRSSILFPYFDVPCLSWDVGMKKPDPALFTLCMNRLGLRADECLYVGDGGSHELEAATACGMHAVQVGWYLREFAVGDWRKPDFPAALSPMEILRFAGIDPATVR